MDKIIHDNKICDIHVYFNRPSILSNLTYTKFFQQYTYSNKCPTRFNTMEINNNDSSHIFKINMLPLSKTIFLFKRNEKSKSITRLEMVPLTIGEKWYLRLILYSRPVLTFKDARTVNGITYSTFQLAALAAHLVDDENEVTIAFQWAILSSTPSELRTLFVIMTTEGFPTAKLYEDLNLRTKLMEDFLIDNANNIR